MKLFHNKFISRALAIILGLACALYFGWTFSYFGYWMGSHFQGALPEAPSAIALACGVVMFLAVLYVFFYIEYTREDVLAYEAERGDGTFEQALKRLKWSVLVLELFSLLFRWIQLNFAPIGIAMIGIGLGLLWLAHLFGKIVHAQANVPYDVEAERVMRHAGVKVWSIAGKRVRTIKDVNQLREISTGNLDPLDNVKDIREQERISSATREQARLQEKQTRRGRAREVARKWMQPRNRPFQEAQSSQAETLSHSNGRQ